MKNANRIIPGLLEIRNTIKSGNWNLMLEMLDKNPRAAVYLEAEKYKNSFPENPKICLLADIAMQTIVENEDAAEYNNIMESLVCAVDKYENASLNWA